MNSLKKFVLIAVVLIVSTTVFAQDSIETAATADTMETSAPIHPYLPDTWSQILFTVGILLASFFIGYFIFSARLENALSKKVSPSKLMLRCIWFLPLIIAAAIVFIFGIYAVPQNIGAEITLSEIFHYAITNLVLVSLAALCVILSLVMLIIGFSKR
jgi:hypothetical protein